MSPVARPGDANWRPGGTAFDDPQRGRSHQLLRILSVVPFVLAGAVGVIAAVSWLLVLVLGVGTSRGSVLQWAAGRSVVEALPQIGVLVLLGAACVAFTVASMWASLVALRPTQPAWFWPLAEAVWALAGIGLLYVATSAGRALGELGLAGRDLYFALGLVVFSLVTIGARHRLSRQQRQ